MAELETCGARIEIPNGETVTPCDLSPKHQGRHYGWCLGSRFVWADGNVTPEEFTEAHGDEDGWL